jgi:hypothetical protein
MLRADVALKGGITPMIKIAHLAEAFRMKCEIHHGGNSLNNVANHHVTMAIPNCEYFEVLQPDAAQKHGLVQDIEVDRNAWSTRRRLPGWVTKSTGASSSATRWPNCIRAPALARECWPRASRIPVMMSRGANAVE